MQSRQQKKPTRRSAFFIQSLLSVLLLLFASTRGFGSVSGTLSCIFHSVGSALRSASGRVFSGASRRIFSGINGADSSILRCVQCTGGRGRCFSSGCGWCWRSGCFSSRCGRRNWLFFLATAGKRECQQSGEEERVFHMVPLRELTKLFRLRVSTD